MGKLVVPVLSSGVVSAVGLAGCGAATVDRSSPDRLRTAIGAEVTDSDVLASHNRIVREVVDGGALEGLRTFEVEERIGRGTQCGIREACLDRGFRSSDWIYDVGHQPGEPDLAAGPLLLVGFDTAGIVERTHYVVRE